MIYTKYWKEYVYKIQNNTEENGIGILYVRNNPFWIYYKNGAILYFFAEYALKIEISL